MEQRVWDYLARSMKGRWFVQRHEDRYSDSIPDVSFVMTGVSGWLELKQISTWPKKDTTPINIPHLESGQVNWLEQVSNNGGNAWMLLVIGDQMALATWFLIPASDVRKIYDRLYTQDDMYRFPHTIGAHLHHLFAALLTKL